MAQLMSLEKKFQDRGYIYQKPSEMECYEMGWQVGYIPPVSNGYNTPVRTWLKDTIWWQDYVIGEYGTVYFKHERDLLMFKLRWS